MNRSNRAMNCTIRLKKLFTFICLCLILTTSAKGVDFYGGGIFDITTQITNNNEDVHLWDGTLNLNPNGVIGNSLVLFYSNSTANFLGGRIDNFVYLNNGTLNIHSGDIHNDVVAGVSWWAKDQPMGLGQVNIYGGNFTNSFGVARSINAQGNGRIDLFGGNFTNNSLSTAGQGYIYIHGSNFNYDPGLITSTEGNLTGILSSGETFNMPFRTGGKGAIYLVTTVPEASTLIMIISGLTLLIIRKRYFQ